MSSFLNRYAGGGGTSFGQGAAERAMADGYSPKQIAVALTQNQHGLNVGDRWRPGALPPSQSAHHAAAISTKGQANNWLHNYQNPSGAIGMEGLMRALGDGKTPQDLIAAGVSGMTSGAGHTSSYFPMGIMGYGEEASAYLAKFLKKKEPRRQEYSAPTPMNAPEPPGSRYGGADLTSGYTAQGLASPQPENYDNTRGGTREAFGRSKKREKDRRQRVNPAMMINPIST